jgi:oxygen-dependent protoporphyrinogen oxidase
MPQFVAMEREHGSLIAALQARTQQRAYAPQPIFTSLRGGVATAVERLVMQLPANRVHLNSPVTGISPTPNDYEISFGAKRFGFTRCQFADHILVATPMDVAREFLSAHIDREDLRSLMPTDASSAILVAFGWTRNLARTFTIPSGFGFLVPQGSASDHELLACTFVDQKFPHRAPEGARVMRAFFGGESAEALSSQSNEAITKMALTQLRNILGPIPEPSFHTVRCWPRSLPQYEVGHLERITELERLVEQVPGLHLLGNSYRGVGIPDLIRDARAAARAIAND